MTKTWDVDQKEIEAQVDSSLDDLNISTLRPSDLMAFDKDQYAYLHYVKRVPNKFTNPVSRVFIVVFSSNLFTLFVLRSLVELDQWIPTKWLTEQ